jgi:hypothetical protein
MKRATVASRFFRFRNPLLSQRGGIHIHPPFWVNTFSHLFSRDRRQTLHPCGFPGDQFFQHPRIHSPATFVISSAPADPHRKVLRRREAARGP